MRNIPSPSKTPIIQTYGEFGEYPACVDIQYDPCHLYFQITNFKFQQEDGRRCEARRKFSCYGEKLEFAVLLYFANLTTTTTSLTQPRLICRDEYVGISLHEIGSLAKVCQCFLSLTFLLRRLHPKFHFVPLDSLVKDFIFGRIAAKIGVGARPVFISPSARILSPDSPKLRLFFQPPFTPRVIRRARRLWIRYMLMERTGD